jgi:hypothetical protein
MLCKTRKSEFSIVMHHQTYRTRQRTFRLRDFAVFNLFCVEQMCLLLPGSTWSIAGGGHGTSKHQKTSICFSEKFNFIFLRCFLLCVVDLCLASVFNIYCNYSPEKEEMFFLLRLCLFKSIKTRWRMFFMLSSSVDVC